MKKNIFYAAIITAIVMVVGYFYSHRNEDWNTEKFSKILLKESNEEATKTFDYNKDNSEEKEELKQESKIRYKASQKWREKLPKYIPKFTKGKILSAHEILDGEEYDVYVKITDIKG